MIALRPTAKPWPRKEEAGESYIRLLQQRTHRFMEQALKVARQTRQRIQNEDVHLLPRGTLVEEIPGPLLDSASLFKEYNHRCKKRGGQVSRYHKACDIVHADHCEPVHKWSKLQGSFICDMRSERGQPGPSFETLIEDMCILGSNGSVSSARISYRAWLRIEAIARSFMPKAGRSKISSCQADT